MSLRLALGGASGRMGRALIRAIQDAPDLTLSGGLTRSGGEDLGALAGGPPLGLLSSGTAAAAATGADGWIDFSSPGAVAETLAQLPASVRFAVIGVTGLDAAAKAAIAAFALRAPVVLSENFSLGVAVLEQLVQQAAAMLEAGSWDIEIIETHHRRKLDSPSGTALLLGAAAARGRAAALEALRLPPRSGQDGLRPEGGVGFASLRGGGVVGDHAVLFAAEREVLSLSHRALDRAVFADGALFAARWAATAPPGLHALRDLLAPMQERTATP
jgi:4-hydroxy-tetrahydrodipicolinate reductase